MPSPLHTIPTGLSRLLLALPVAMVAFLALPSPAAAQFAVAPIRIDMTAERRDAEFKITNEADQPLDIQLQLMAWTQVDGADRFEETRQVLVFPRIVRIEAGAEQLIRVAHRLRGEVGAEQAYRLYAQQLQSAAEADSPLRFSLRVSVPVFITGSRRGEPVPELRGSSLEQGVLSVRVGNTGTVHTRVEEVKVQGFDAQGNATLEATGQGWYLLAGGERGYEVQIPEAECLASARLHFVATTTEGEELDGEVAVAADACRRPTETQEPTPDEPQ